MTRSTILKLLVPVLYAFLTFAYFLFILQNKAVHIHQVVGMILTGVAFILWIAARIQLGNSFTIGAHAKHLVTTGLYTKLRHPVYYFSVLAVIGIAIFVWNMYMVVPVILLIVVEMMRIRQEERVLAKAFGKEYLRYKQTTWF